MTNSILRLPAALECTGLSRSTIYLRVSEDKFPRSISLGGRAVGRREPEIDEWLDACVTARGGDRSSASGRPGPCQLRAVNFTSGCDVFGDQRGSVRT